MNLNRLRPDLLLAALLLVAAVPAAYAQNVQYSISNEFRYGIGEQFEQDKAFRKEYLENLFNTRIYVGDVTFGFRVQLDKPREYGPDTLGLTEYYAEFQRNGLRARGGTFYQLLGRGLVFNTFESRPIGFETRTLGAKLDYETEEVGVNAFGGILTYPDILIIGRREEYLVRGASGEVRPIPEVGVGGSFVAASGRPTLTGFFTPFDVYLREAFVRGNYEGLRAYFNYADKRTQTDSTTRSLSTSQNFGHGWYGMLGYDTDVFGVTLEYKDYRFDLVTPNQQIANSRETRALPFQSPPTLLPEYDKTLLARNPHAIDISDELGFQFESLVYPAEELTLTFVAAAGSRHNAWNATWVEDSVNGDRAVYVRENANALIVPEFSDVRFSPYWELYAHGDYQVNEDLSLGLGIQRRDNVIYHEGNGEAIPISIENYKATTLMTEAIASLTPRDNLHAILEMQRVYDSNKKSEGVDSLGIAPYEGIFNNLLLTLEYSRSPVWAVNTRIEWTTTDREQGGKRLWPVVGATYRIGNEHTVGVQYGSERGGVVCTGGVCRLVNPFTGFRLSVVSKL